MSSVSLMTSASFKKAWAHWTDWPLLQTNLMNLFASIRRSLSFNPSNFLRQDINADSFDMMYNVLNGLWFWCGTDSKDTTNFTKFQIYLVSRWLV